MKQVIQIQWSAANLEEARKVANLLVVKKMAACVQILPQMESIYLWKEQVETSSEVKVFIKTTQDFFSGIVREILSHTAYELPEILYTKVDGFPPYLEWVEKSVF